MYQPTLHKPVPLGSDVVIPVGPYNGSDKPRTGKVVGISSTHVLFHYIVLLDDGCEYHDGYGTHKAVSVIGTALEKPGGGNWKLDNEYPF